MKEVTKATSRRLNDPVWRKIFAGQGLDVHIEEDTLKQDDWHGITSLCHFGPSSGDYNYLSTYYQKNQFDFIHASQVLHCARNPRECIKDWVKSVKPGGYVVISVPDFYIYEHGNWPSKYNSDHKSSWSITRPASICQLHQHVADSWPSGLGATWYVKPKLVDTRYNYSLPFGVDQTANQADGVECWIEFVLQKT